MKFMKISVFLVLFYFVAFVAACARHGGQQGHGQGHEVIPSQGMSSDIEQRQDAITLHSHSRASGEILCPVCGMVTTKASPHVEIATPGTQPQTIYVCSKAHGDALKKDPFQYREPTTPPAAGTDFHPISPTVQCPFCKMDAVKEHALPLKNGQAIHSCQMTHYDRLVNNATALSEKMTVKEGKVQPSGKTLCPVCGMAVSDKSPYVSIRNGQQKIYACSTNHAELLLAEPVKYMMKAAEMFKETKTGPVQPIRQCPFCNMDAVYEHNAQFNYGQNIYSCPMTPHYEQLRSNHDLVTTFSGVVVDGQPVEPQNHFCLGSGTVMLNGLTFSTNICIVYLFEGVVLDQRWKFGIACVGTFLLGVLVQVILYFRSDLQVRQNDAQLFEERPPAIDELLLNSTLFCVSVFLGYMIMLLTMTYSWQIVFMVVFGLTTGHFFCALASRTRGKPQRQVETVSSTACNGCS